MKLIHLMLGYLSLAAGIAGLALPLVPTVPFLLLAAYFFSRSSERLSAWLIAHPRLGPPIRAWREQHAIPLRGKIAATILIGASAVIMQFEIASLPVRMTAFTVLAGVLLFIWTRALPR